MILGGLHQDLLRRVINGVTLRHVPTGLVGSTGVCRKPFKNGLILMWTVSDGSYITRVLFFFFNCLSTAVSMISPISRVLSPNTGF